MMDQDDRRHPSCNLAPSKGGRATLALGAALFSVALAALLVVGASCSRSEGNAQSRAPEDLAERTPAAAVPRAASIVTSMKDGVLNQCDDFTITHSQGFSNNASAETDLVEGIVQGFLKRNIGASRLGKLCGDEFRAKTVLATCITHISSELTKSDTDASLGIYDLQMTSRYYNLETLAGSDAYMKDCTARNGDWQALDKNSEEYKAAVKERVRYEIEKAKSRE